MKTQYKIAVASIPFLLAGLVLSSMTYPKYLEDKDKTSELTQKDEQYKQLQLKLQQRVKAESDKKTLETDIETLRGAVPKSPELDLMMIDLEKMCVNSNVHLIAVETPSQELMRQISTSEDEIKELIGEREGKIGLGTATLQKSGTTPGAKVEAPPPESGLKRLIKQVYVSGDYNGMVGLMKRLESYQRTVGVEEISIAIKTSAGGESNEHSAASERAQKLGLSKPVMAFLLTLYYLP
jgi:Tfp pilus assembly protein PilO